MTEQFVAEYLRVSIEDGDIILDCHKTESNTISNQRKLIEAYRKAERLYPEKAVLEFVDDGYSGTNFERPEVRKLLSLVREGKICCILVKDISRFGRDYLEVGDYLEQIFPFMGVRFIAINDGYDSDDYIGTTGGIEIGFKSLLYSMYSKDLSVKMKSALAVRRKRGDFIGPRAPFGYQFGENKRRLVVDRKAAPYVRQIFQLACEGYSTGEIAVRMNEEGVPTPGAYKNLMRKEYHILDGTGYWDRSKVLNILQNKVYLGTVVNGKRKAVRVGGKHFASMPEDERIYVPHRHEPIVTEQEFLEASKVIKRGIGQRQKGKGREVKEESALLGILRCGKCGRSLIRVTCTTIPYFTCKKAAYDKNSGCLRGSVKVNFHTLFVPDSSMTARVKEPDAEEIVLGHINEKMGIRGREEHKDLAEQGNIDVQKKRNRGSGKQRETLNMEKQRLYEQMKMGEIDKKIYMDKMVSVREKERLCGEIRDYEESVERESTANKGGIGKVESLTRELVERLIERIDVYDEGRFELVWK